MHNHEHIHSDGSQLPSGLQILVVSHVANIIKFKIEKIVCRSYQSVAPSSEGADQYLDVETLNDGYVQSFTYNNDQSIYYTQFVDGWYGIVCVEDIRGEEFWIVRKHFT